MINKKVTHILIFPPSASSCTDTFITYDNEKQAIEEYKAETDGILYKCKEIRRKGKYRK